MDKNARHEWIREYMQARNDRASTGFTVDVLDTNFVCDYIDATNAPCAIMPYGAPKCSQLGRDLSEMHAAGILTRYATGLQGMAGMGFPRWVYVYRLAKLKDLDATYRISA